MFQFELLPHTGEIRTEILVYEKGGLIKHVKAPAINKVDLLDLGKKWTLWQCGIWLNILYQLQYHLYVCLTVCHMVWNITMTLQFTIIQNVLFHIVTHLEFCHTMAASQCVFQVYKLKLYPSDFFLAKHWILALLVRNNFCIN